MTDFVRQYFYDQENGDSIYNPPASKDQILNLEKSLAIHLPDDYKDFLLTTNGFEGQIGEFITIFEPVENIIERTRLNCTKYFHWAIFIGSNGNLEMFVIDKRSIDLQFGLLPFIADDNDFIPLGNSFEQFLKRLKEGTAFQKQ